jgi:hypothetical protein
LKRRTLTRSRPDHGLYQRILLLFVAVCVIFSLGTTVTVFACETGIRGTVLWGPVKPGPSKLGQTDEAPLRAYFAIYEAGTKVAEFESDRNGRFEVSLPPGDYTIVPDKQTPIPYAQQQKTKVTVPEDGFAVVGIRLDTGMR